ncbi:MAG: CHAT domain-containing protein, partial [Candidatus Brocadiales bacterium]|nr:CHAT domain-containing protein [Candidatus Bathyanammoxibius sp.]
GVLGFLPFETLIDNNGQYLVETYHIAYTQSMGVLELIKSRQYKGNRKPLLAFGGAVYDELAYAVDMVENENQLAYLEKNIYSAFQSRGSVRNAYASLGVGDWGNLPASLSEVKAIRKVVKGAEIITGKKVTESEVKGLSKSGKLAGYKVLHFATHGLVVPAMPELSAVVLSQFKKEQRDEDGYLRMAEIADLKIQADFVNLSACETGLGKIYGGEGVVGLTQSFLIAGANGLSVSLWQVADVSTSRFMVAMYESVQKNNMGYADAITEVKRRFIKGDFGDKYRFPYYWAPFVYYGR